LYYVIDHSITVCLAVYKEVKKDYPEPMLVILDQRLT